MSRIYLQLWKTVNVVPKITSIEMVILNESSSAEIKYILFILIDKVQITKFERSLISNYLYIKSIIMIISLALKV